MEVGDVDEDMDIIVGRVRKVMMTEEKEEDGIEEVEDITEEDIEEEGGKEKTEMEATGDKNEEAGEVEVDPHLAYLAEKSACFIDRNL